jgi:hypothetical protein
VCVDADVHFPSAAFCEAVEKSHRLVVELEPAFISAKGSVMEELFVR